MTTHTDYNDKSMAVLFATVGVLGVLPALYKLFTVGWVAVIAVTSIADGRLDGAGTLAVCLGIIGVTLHGFWLLWQYIKRAHGTAASIPQHTLWQLTTVQNALYLIASVALFFTMLSGPECLYMVGASAWFAGLTWCAANAARRSRQ